MEKHSTRHIAENMLLVLWNIKKRPNILAPAEKQNTTLHTLHTGGKHKNYGCTM